MESSNKSRRVRRWLLGVCALIALGGAADAAPFMVVGLDQKMAWDDAGHPVLTAPGRDRVAIIDLRRPGRPKIVAVLPLENSIQGPPTNLAISPDDSLAIIANSVTNRPATDGKFEQVPTDQLFVIDLKSRKPKLVQTLNVGKQPSGLSINPAGTMALVTYRGETAVGVFRIDRGRLQDVGRVDVGQSPAHVAFTPDGRRALVVKQGANTVSLLNVGDEGVTFRADLPMSDGPYNVEVTPDGRTGVVSERGLLSLIDMSASPERRSGTVRVGQGSEGLAISPRGDIVVSVALLGSNGPHVSPGFHERGAIVVLAADGKTLRPVKTIEVGRVPEGVAFSPDGGHLYVANFYDDNIWIFRVEGNEVADTGRRLKLPGRPASARATPGRARAARPPEKR